MRRAKVRITNELFLQQFHFPDGTSIVDAKMTDDRRDIEILVDSPDLPELAEGSQPPYINPKYTKQEPILFDWNLPQ